MTRHVFRLIVIPSRLFQRVADIELLGRLSLTANLRVDGLDVLAELARYDSLLVVFFLGVLDSVEKMLAVAFAINPL